MLAARERRIDDARVHVREALEAGVPREACLPFAAAWTAAQPTELSAELEDALLAAVWQDIHAWPAWIDPIVAGAHGAVMPRDRVPPPWHFGGPRVAIDGELVAGWLVERAERLATPVEGVGKRELPRDDRRAATCVAARLGSARRARRGRRVSRGAAQRPRR